MRSAVLPFWLVLLLAFTVGAEELSSKNDFRGIRCGAAPSADMERKYYAAESPLEADRRVRETSVIEYTRQNDHHSIGDVQLEEITYEFFDGHFMRAVMAPTTEQSGDASLLDTLTVTFGKPKLRLIPPFDCEYSWNGAHMMISAPGSPPIPTGDHSCCGRAYSASFICKDVLAAEVKARESRTHEENVRKEEERARSARSKTGDF